MTSLRIHRYLECTEVNGPGKRFCLWVQGCRGVPQPDGMIRHCQGCWNSHTWAQNQGTETTIDEVFAIIAQAVREYGLDGITFSGGEPFQQASALAKLANRCQTELGLNVMAFTGYTLEHLCSEQASEGSGELLQWLDLLVDGPYVQEQTTADLPLRGSSNQSLRPLNEMGAELAMRVTSALPVIEFHISTAGETVVTGFPISR